MHAHSRGVPGGLIFACPASADPLPGARGFSARPRCRVRVLVPITVFTLVCDDLTDMRRTCPLVTNLANKCSDAVAIGCAGRRQQQRRRRRRDVRGRAAGCSPGGCAGSHHAAQRRGGKSESESGACAGAVRHGGSAAIAAETEQIEGGVPEDVRASTRREQQEVRPVPHRIGTVTLARSAAMVLAVAVLGRWVPPVAAAAGPDRRHRAESVLFARCCPLLPAAARCCPLLLAGRHARRWLAG
eukprot:SAG22_NODE_826_length_6962_cov_20.142358_3_plen_243_part_00